MADPVARGIREETLDSLVRKFQRQVIVERIERETTMKSAAESLGLTREGLWKLRRRLGIPIEPQEKPIPDDWRERLTT